MVRRDKIVLVMIQMIMIQMKVIGNKGTSEEGKEYFMENIQV